MAAAPPGPDTGKKPAAPPHPVVLADAKLTVRAPAPRVFEALVNPETLTGWWAADVNVEAEVGGRYEGTLAEGRVEGTITGIDGPGLLAYVWPMPGEGGSIETSVHFDLSPRGPETLIHLSHRSPRPVPGDWNGLWHRALETLKALLEGDAPTSA